MIKQKKKKATTKLIEAINIVADVKDFQKFPYSYKDKSIKEITCIGVIEYIDGKLRGKFMDELYRILTDDGKVNIVVPYWSAAMGIQDYRYAYPPLVEQSFLYFNKGWRDANGLKLGIVCDWDFNYGYTADPETSARNDETRSFNIKHYNNTVQLLHVSLTKKLSK